MATAGVGMGPSKQDIHTHGGEPGHERILDHVAGKPCVLADDDPMAVIAALERKARPPDRRARLDRA